MKKYRFSAKVTVSAMTVVNADTQEKAREIAESRDVEITEGFVTEYDCWIIEEADGEPQAITLEGVDA